MNNTSHGIEASDTQGAALLLRWDLGRDSRQSGLIDAQTLVTDVTESIGLLVSVQRRTPRYPGGVLLERNGRQYLRARSPYLRPIPAPVVAASGFSNPWWEILQEAAAVKAAAGAGATLALLGVIQHALDAVKRVALFSDEIAHDRRQLQTNAIEIHPELSALTQADAVDVTGGTAPRHDIDRRRPSPRRPSVPADMPALDAITALAADRALDAMAALTDAIRRGGEFDVELLEADEASRRIPIARRTQLALYEYAGGAIDLNELQERIGAPDAPEIPGTPATRTVGGHPPTHGHVGTPRRPTAQLEPPPGAPPGHGPAT